MVIESLPQITEPVSSEGPLEMHAIESIRYFLLAFCGCIHDMAAIAGTIYTSIENYSDMQTLWAKDGLDGSFEVSGKAKRSSSKS